MLTVIPAHLATERESSDFHRTTLGPRLRGDDQPHAFSTWEKSSSTGVDRPKIVTDTLSLLFS